MMVNTRQCDVCEARHDNTGPEYYAFAQLIEAAGNQLDVCPDCQIRLMEPKIQKISESA